MYSNVHAALAGPQVAEGSNEEYVCAQFLYLQLLVFQPFRCLQRLRVLNILIAIFFWFELIVNVIAYGPAPSFYRALILLCPWRRFDLRARKLSSQLVESGLLTRVISPRRY